jgi:hypothetical protein
MEERYTKEEIAIAIDMCKKYTIEVKTPSNIDGMLGGEIETIELKYFLHNLERVHNRL